MLPLSPLMLADWRLYSVLPILYPLYRPMRAQQRRRRTYVVVVDLFLDPGEFQWLITIFRTVRWAFHPSTSSSPPSHTILPTRWCKCRVWRSKMISVSNFSNLDIRSLIKPAFPSVVWSFTHVAFLCLTGVSHFLCGTNILSLPDGGVNRVMGKPGWAKELSS